MFRSVSDLQDPKRTRISYFTCCQSLHNRYFTGKNDKYSFFLLYPYNNVWVNLGIINIVSYVFLIDCKCNIIPRSLIPSSSCLFLPPKCPCNLQLKFKLTEMHKSQLWALVIVFWLVFIAPNFGKLLSA